MIRKKISIGYRAFLYQVSKILLCAFLTFVIGYFINLGLSSILADGFVLKIVKVLIVNLIALVCYICFAHILKVEYLEDLKDKITAKFKKGENNA